MSLFAVSRTDEQLSALRRGSVVVRVQPAVFRIVGSGALDCLQGLLTNDLAAPGLDRLVYGALLTPKGMIVADYFVFRTIDGFVLVAAPDAHDPTLELFRRQIPPRLAKVTDLTGLWAALLVLGDGAESRLDALVPGLAAAEPATVHRLGDSGALVARGTSTSPFEALVAGPLDAVESAEAALIAAGAERGDADDAEAARILAGWPRLGTEIGERTLPQEVRYDEIGGVSYTKGCYVGQETVARLHFRGHTNRDLRGVVWARDVDPPDSGELRLDGKAVGEVRSVLRLDGRALGLALIRREVDNGTMLEGDAGPVRVVPLPFGPHDAD
jgi:folate-binding protein YgfZ